MEEIKITKIQTVNLSPLDSMIVHIDVGQMQPRHAEVYMKRTAAIIKEQFPNTKLLVLPSTVEISIVQDETA